MSPLNTSAYRAYCSTRYENYKLILVYHNLEITYLFILTIHLPNVLNNSLLEVRIFWFSASLFCGKSAKMKLVLLLFRLWASRRGSHRVKSKSVWKEWARRTSSDAAVWRDECGPPAGDLKGSSLQLSLNKGDNKIWELLAIYQGHKIIVISI